MYNKKGMTVATFAIVFVVATAILFFFVGFVFHPKFEGSVIELGGGVISLSNNVDFWIRLFDESLSIISKKAAYDLALKGGIDVPDVAIWTVNHPTMLDLTNALREKIGKNLPTQLQNGKEIKFREDFIIVRAGNAADINIDGVVDSIDLKIISQYYMKPAEVCPLCDLDNDGLIGFFDFQEVVVNMGTVSTFESFIVNGIVDISVFDDIIDSEIISKQKLNSLIESNYLKLLRAGRAIVEDPQFNQYLNDTNALLSEINNAKAGGDPRFVDLDFEATLISSETGGEFVPATLSGLVAHWKFDEGAGNIVMDSSGNGNDGTLLDFMPSSPDDGNTPPQWVEGRFGSGLEFDGADDYVEIPDDPTLRASNNQITIEMWIKRNTVPTSSQILINKIWLLGGNYNCTYWLGVPTETVGMTETKSEFEYFSSPFVSTQSVDFGIISDLNWHHLTATYDGNELRSYLDGNLISTQVTTIKQMPFTNTPVRIGGDIIFHNYFDGVMDEVRIYDRALSESEIKAGYGALGSVLVEINITEDCFPAESHCIAPINPGEPGIINSDGNPILHDYLKLRFRALGSGTIQVAECDDRFDNDGDGSIDFPTDSSCTSENDNSECGDFAGECIVNQHCCGALICDSGFCNIISGPLTVAIGRPKNMETFSFGELINFRAVVGGGTPAYSYSWTSSLDGFIGNTQTFSNNGLSMGVHTITLTVTDGVGTVVTDIITIYIIPSSFDWRNYQGKNWMTDVRTQGCDDCWAFSTLGPMEAKYNIQNNDDALDIDLSEQYLVSDCYSDGNCGGGSPAFDFIKNSGVVDEACYPYLGTNSICSNRCANWDTRLWNISDYGPVDNVQSTIKRYLIDKGPLFAAMIISAWNPVTYRCSPGTSDHGVVIVGYDDAQSVWIVRNSWGSSWEDAGYFRVEYCNCNIEQECYYYENVIAK